MTTLDLPLRAPGGEPVDLWRTLVSHGFAELSPTHLDEEHRTLAFTVRVPGGRPRRVRISEGARRTARLEILGPPPGPKVVRAVLHGAAHVLRLDQDLSPFYLLTEGDPDLAWAATGAGRMLRSPTVFEDVVKTVCTTNCAWSATVRMVDALVTNLGEPAVGGDGPLTNAFPSPEAMAGAYANFANISHSDYEFTITFARLDHDIDEDEIPGVVVSRISASPKFVAPQTKGTLKAHLSM